MYQNIQELKKENDYAKKKIRNLAADPTDSAQCNGTHGTNRMQIYEAAIMKQYQISYTTFIRYVKETNVQEQIAEYSQLRPDNV